MKKALLLLAALLFSVMSLFAQSKHALIIAIGDYPEETDWKDISSVNDLSILKPSFKKAGFQHIHSLVNEEATREGIINAFKQLAAQLKAGDQVIVHISSHGQQIWDDNGDEVDGYDEAIVAYGAPAFFSNDYKGDRHLRDEELGALLDELRVKCGKSGDVLVFIDACHSGTGTRGEAKVRGGVPAMAPPGWTPVGGHDKNAALFENRAYGMGLQEQSPMVVLSAARSEELNYEYNGFGSLSVAIQRVLNALNEGMTYRSFFAAISKEMSVIAPRQNPAIEGDVDRELFGGAYRQQEAYYELKSVDKNWIVLKGGELTGIFKDCEMTLYPAGTVSTAEAEAVAKGRIVGADPTESNLQLDENISGKPEDYWAFISKKSFGDQSIRLHVHQSGNKKLEKHLSESFEDHPIVKVVKSREPADFSLMENKDGQIYLHRAGSGALFNSENQPTAISSDPKTAHKDLEEQLTNYARGRFIKTIEMDDRSISVSFKLIPVEIENGRITDTLDDDEVFRNGMLEIVEGQKLLVEITNKSAFPLYFNLVDVQPDGIINLLMPDPYANESAAEYKIPANSTYLCPKYIEIYPPYGKEVFKVFASKKPIDFSAIHTSRGQNTRGAESEIEKLFGSTYQIGTRGGKPGSLSSGSGVETVSQTFIIKKP